MKMKGKPILLILLVSSFFISGCFLNSFFFQRDLIEVQELLGTWDRLYMNSRNQNMESVTFTKIKDKKKYLIKRSWDNYQYYEAGFLKIDNMLFADIVDYAFGEKSLEENAVHHIWRFEVFKDSFHATLLDVSYLLKSIDSGKFKLKTKSETDRSSDYNIGTVKFVSASTSELQKFIKAHYKDEKLFPKKSTLVYEKVPQSFLAYFPKESWDFYALRKSNAIPDSIKYLFNHRWNKLKEIPRALAPGFKNAPQKLKPYYFKAIANTLSIGKFDSELSTVCTEYVQQNTSEFLHYFIGTKEIGDSEMTRWATIIRKHLKTKANIDQFINQIRNHCKSCSSKEKRLLKQFVVLMTRRV